MPDESMWIERAQSAEATNSTLREQNDRLKADVRDAMENLCALRRSDGVIDIDFEKLAQRLSTEHALELRALIDAHHRISGAPGEKPRVRMAAQAAAG